MHNLESRERLWNLALFGALMAFVSLVVLCGPALSLASGVWDEACGGGLFGIIERSVAPFAIGWAPFLVWSIVSLSAFRAWRRERPREPRFSLALAGLPIVSAAYLGTSVEARGPEPVVAAGGAVVALVLLALAVPFLQRLSARAAIIRVASLGMAFGLAVLLAGCGSGVPDPTVGQGRGGDGSSDAYTYARIEFVDSGTVEGFEPEGGVFRKGDSLAEATYDVAFSGERITRMDRSDDVFSETTSVGFALGERGKEELKELTEGMMGRQLLLVLDGEVISAPVVRQVVSDGVISITGAPQEMIELETRLRERSSGD